MKTLEVTVPVYLQMIKVGAYASVKTHIRMSLILSCVDKKMHRTKDLQKEKLADNKLL